MNKKRVISFLLALLMVSTMMPMLVASATNSQDVVAGGETAVESTTESSGALSELSYYEYLEAHKDAKTDVKDVEIDVLNYVGTDGVVTENIKDDNGKAYDAVKLVVGGNVEWKVNITEPGLYNISTIFMPIVDKPINAEVRIYIDGVTPFTEATAVTFGRVWKDSYGENTKFNEYGHKVDASGNELSPDSVEVSRWTDYVLHDNDYMTDADFLFYLSEGEHTISFKSQREAVAFASLKLTQQKSVITYEEYLALHSDAEVYTGDPIRFEAENSYEHSERNLSMWTSYSSASTSPSHYSQIRLSNIGGETWNKVGKWISWEVEVEEDGLYAISYKYMQNYVRGFKVYRTLMLDGELPYAEMKTVSFDPNTDWKNYTVGNKDGEAYYLYLTAGKKHVITLTATLGPLVDSLQALQNCINELNNDYLQIIAVTGTTPDTLRDYDLDREIPTLIDSFKAVNKDLKKIGKDLSNFNSGLSGGMSAFIDVMTKQLDKFIKNPLEITEDLNAYKTNISSLSDMLSDMSNQSLLFDVFYLGGENDLPKTQASFWESLKFTVLSFFASFTTDYNAYGNNYTDGEDGAYVCEPITVWMSSGRDQFNVLKTIIDDKFVPEYGIPVDMSLVPVGSALTQAILAGIGPDACLYVDDATPVNYSMRGSLEDMNQFNAENQYDSEGNLNYKYTFEEVKSWFYDSAFVPLTYFDNKVYGLPQTQEFQMMFYREDVLAELGIDVPETWEDLRDCLTIIQRENMNVGINGVGINTYLYQAGGTFYNEDLTATNITTHVAVDAFDTFTSLYTDYGVALAYDALNRFRSGEYPIVFQNYSFYNNLNVGAPEIKGLWKMTAIPGTEREDGTVNHASTTFGTVCIMLKGCENKNRVYDFLTWWVSADTQASYGNNLEARLGAGGRYTTANKEAFEMLPWSYDDANEIKEAWADMINVPKVPGDYYVQRMLDNAFRAVVYSGENVREALVRYSKEIDKELVRKREQYGIDEIVAAAKANK